jgi:hypothetical protein
MTGRGAVPYDVQLVDSTVQGLLGSDVKFSTTTPAAGTPGASTTPAAPAAAPVAAPAKATAAPTAKKTLTQGLMGALNEYQKALVERGIFKIADEYSIEFQGIPGVPASAIADATLKPIGQVKDDKKKTGAPPPGTKNPQSLKQDTNTVDSVSQTFSITAGQMITQAIELTIRNSSYISNQQLVIVQPDGTSVPNPNSRNKPVSWFIITMFATAQPGGIDPLRNDYAYKIKYVVRPFIPSSLNSKYFPASKFNGIHKRYPYWFTGQNTAVLDYTANFNHTYSQTISGTGIGDNQDAQLRAAQTSNMYDLMQYSFSPRSQASNKGASGKGNEIAANAAEYLYMYAEPGGSKLRIIGDPAWIQQGSLAGGVSAAEFSYNPFNPDGTINFDSEQVLFEIAWQRPEDYDIATGLADPYARPGNTARKPIQSNVYQAIKVVSEFKGGKFEQTVTGTLFMLPTASGKNTAAGAATAPGSGNGLRNAVDPRRFDNPTESAVATRPTAPAANTTTPVDANNQRVPAGVFSSPDYSTYQSQAAGLVPGGPLSTPKLPFAVPNRLSGAFSAPPPGAADTIAPAAAGQGASGSGVVPVAFGNAPLPLNTLPFAIQGKAQLISKDF